MRGRVQGTEVAINVVCTVHGRGVCVMCRVSVHAHGRGLGKRIGDRQLEGKLDAADGAVWSNNGHQMRQHTSIIDIWHRTRCWIGGSLLMLTLHISQSCSQ